jgi:medium-chain acyl-[acyl-carrier-protein] hydrolase
MTNTNAKPPARSLWFIPGRPGVDPSLRLFCFPYAGGGAVIYRRWAESLPRSVEVLAVQPPGRGNRIREAPLLRVSAIVEALAAEVVPYLDRPFAFFGHSLGALVAFELARRLRRERGVEPARLFVSGRRAPHVPGDEPVTHDLPATEFIAELRRLNGTPPEVLEHEELMELMIPLLRADFEVCETYKFEPGPPLTCPVTAFGGIEDRDVTREYIAAWREHTTGPFLMRMLPGDHFFIHSAEATLLQVVARELHELTTARGAD